ncbi:MAG: hypothetical protein GX446_11365 [Chthonomonadales bacterium]|nr:hypothetical protein [Chthonomonadales bacterium]
MSRPKTQPIALSIGSLRLEGLFYPPIMDRGVVYVYAGYLRTGQWDAKVVWRDRAAHISLRDGRKAVIPSGEALLVLDGNTCALKTPLRVYRSRAYLPLDAWEILTGWACRWLPESRTVSLDPAPAPKTAMTAGRP